MLPDQNGGGRPGRRPRKIDSSTPAPSSVTANEHAAQALSWFERHVRSGTYQQLEFASEHLCDECIQNRRHPDARHCEACLELGAGDVWSQEVA